MCQQDVVIAAIHLCYQLSSAVPFSPTHSLRACYSYTDHNKVKSDVVRKVIALYETIRINFLLYDNAFVGSYINVICFLNLFRLSPCLLRL